MNIESARDQVNEWVASSIVPGIALQVRWRGETVLNHYAGEAAPGRPIDGETLFALASLSKPINAAAVLRVADEGLIDLNDSVTTYLPEFGQDVDPLDSHTHPMLELERDTVSIRQLLAHTSGLPENIGRHRLHLADFPTMDDQIDLMLQEPLISSPGERLRYSNLGPGIAGRLAERVTGMPIHDLIRRTILEPMGLEDIQLTPTPNLDDRIAIVRDPGNEGTPQESYNSRWWRENGIIWGGFFGTPTALLDFATAFLPGGAIPLSSSAISAMTTDQADGAPGGVESLRALWSPGYWGAGWEVKGHKRNHWTGDLTSPETFLHWGQAGTLALVDPTRDLAIAVFANRSVRTMWPLRPKRWATLCDTIVREVDGART